MSIDYKLIRRIVRDFTNDENEIPGQNNILRAQQQQQQQEQLQQQQQQGQLQQQQQQEQLQQQQQQQQEQLQQQNIGNGQEVNEEFNEDDDYSDNGSVDWDAEFNERLQQDDEAEELIDENFELNEEEIEDILNRQREEDAEEEFNNNQPLYRGTLLSVRESMLLILMIILRHNVNYECLADIISVINMHCLRENLKKISFFKFKRFFSLDANEMIKHYYCSECLKPFADLNDVCHLCLQGKKVYFIQLPFLEQLK